jgi:predicted DNA-binding protein
LTNFPTTVIAPRMGRPPLNKESKTTLTGVRLTDETRDRIEAVAGPNRMAAFIREAIENELTRREAEKS